MDIIHNKAYIILLSFTHNMECCLSNDRQLVNRNLARVSTPFLCLHAENDKICSVEGSRELHDVAHLCKDKALVIFPEVGC